MFRFQFCEVTDITLHDFSNSIPWAPQVCNSCYIRIPSHGQGRHLFWIRANTSQKEHSRPKEPMNQGRILLLDFTTMTQMKLLTVSGKQLCLYHCNSWSFISSKFWNEPLSPFLFIVLLFFNLYFWSWAEFPSKLYSLNYYFREKTKLTCNLTYITEYSTYSATHQTEIIRD